MKERICVSCRTKKNKDDMIKITKTKYEGIIVSPNSKQVGRSVYICKNEACIRAIMKSNKIKNALKINITPEIQELLSSLDKFIDTNLP